MWVTRSPNKKFPALKPHSVMQRLRCFNKCAKSFACSPVQGFATLETKSFTGTSLCRILVWIDQRYILQAVSKPNPEAGRNKQISNDLYRYTVSIQNTCFSSHKQRVALLAVLVKLSSSCSCSSSLQGCLTACSRCITIICDSLQAIPAVLQRAI